MGGRGSGGRRVGSGRKPKRGVVLQHPASAPASPLVAPAIPSGSFGPPAELLGAVEQIAALRVDLAFLQQAAGPGDPNPQIAEIQTNIDALQARAHALAIWHELAPAAFIARTLTPATSAAFVMLCRAVVQERALSASPSTAGGANHRGLMHRVATWMKDFCLSPFGKPLSEASPKAAPVSKWAGILK